MGGEGGEIDGERGAGARPIPVRVVRALPRFVEGTWGSEGVGRLLLQVKVTFNLLTLYRVQVTFYCVSLDRARHFTCTHNY